MYCTNCGKQLLEGARFCIKCGTPVENTSEAVETNPVTEPAEERSEPSDRLTRDEVVNAVWLKVNQIWDWLHPRLIKGFKALVVWGNEVWDRFVAELPVRLPKKLTLIAIIALIVLNTAVGGGAGSSGSDSGSNGGGGSSIFSSGRTSFSPSFSSNCVFCSDGKVTCTACDGDKGKYVYGSVANYSGSTSPNTTTRTWQSCSKCHGSGKQSCTHCGGDGKR